MRKRCSMKRKLMMAVVAAIMVLTMIPATAFAATPATPTGTGTVFFANGVPVTITKEEPQNSQKETLKGFTEGTDAYISWTEGTTTKYVGARKDVSVYGGSDGSSVAVKVESTSITMKSGTVYNLYGGNLGKGNSVNTDTSVVSGNTYIEVSGKESIVENVIVGGGRCNSAVEGTATIKIDGVKFPPDNTCYVMGGNHGNGTEGSKGKDDIEGNVDGTMDTNATVNNVDITVTDSNVYLVTGGGGGHTKVNNASVIIEGSEVNSVYVGGINGEIVNSVLNIADSKIENLAATNRGFVGNGSASIENTKIADMATGAASGCFGSDSSGADGSGVTGTMNWNFGAGVEVTEAAVTPLIKAGSDGRPVLADFGGTIINNAGKNINFNIDSFRYDNEGSTSEFTVDENGYFAISGATVTAKSGTKVVNNGFIDVLDNAAFITEEGSEVTNAKGGLIVVSGTGKVQAVESTLVNYGTVDKHPNAVVEGMTGEPAVNLSYATIDAKAGKGGKITPEGIVYVHLAQEATFTITPDEGYVIADVKVDGKSVGKVDTYTFKDLTAEDYSIEASFEAKAEGAPETGDDSSMMLMVALMAMAAAAGATAFVRRRSN